MNTFKDLFLSFFTWASHHIYFFCAGVGLGVAAAVAILQTLGYGWRKGAASGIVAFFIAAIMSFFFVSGGDIRGIYTRNSARADTARCLVNSSPSQGVCVSRTGGNGLHIDLGHDYLISAVEIRGNHT
ncbi:hypothetical protein [Mycolicibacterium aubagnense]|mgnify:CR=1 FL=1|uniref:Uncharacterized protein n=1 Tax=Mycolicibacterium aubagnense TaxID=319707 RepID=A0ABM7INJ3_9MYCO|nr:hypothetical protein [Mycolicibacterium aubagnense]TLH48595.1 hypothetical protein C1S80_29695 [Mycolicibacterium aubagnense]BBX88331.1 hypothetical protein MAUB_65320 [Mycolicibacterium aubagnense]